MEIDAFAESNPTGLDRIRELNAERRELIDVDDISRRRHAAVERHRRRLRLATAEEFEDRLEVRRSFVVI